MDNEGTTAETLGGSLDVSSKRTLVTLLGKIKNPEDKPAWDRFYLRYHSVIRNMARAYSLRHAPLLNEADLEDIVIDVMDQVSRQAGEFVYRPGKRAFRGFLATVTRRRCIDLQRFRDRRSGVSLPEPEDLDAARDGAVRVNGKIIPDECTDEISKLIEEHDMAVGRALALEKLRSGKDLTKRQFQIFEKLAMGVPPADVCSQLSVTADQIYNARCLAMPFYEKALLEAKKELDSPTEMPPAL